MEDRTEQAEKEVQRLQALLTTARERDKMVDDLKHRLQKSDEEKQLGMNRIIEFEEIVSNLRAKILPLEHQIEEKTKECQKVIELEQRIKRSEFINKEAQEQLIRENRQLMEENELLHKKSREVQRVSMANLTSKNVEQPILKVIGLEDAVRSLKEANENLLRKFDEVDFARKTLEDHQNTLKTEILESNEIVSSLKKEKHLLEIEIIDINNRLADGTVKGNRQKEEVEKQFMDLEYLKAEFDKLDKQYKAEKRKSCTLERDLDQIKYTYDMLHKNTGEEIKSLRDHNTGLKSETKGLQERLEGQFKEMQTKIEEERKNSIKLAKKVKEYENELENLKIQSESTTQMVEFYKQQLQAQGIGVNIAHNHNEMDRKSSQSAHDTLHDSNRRQQNFESFATFQRKVKEINLTVKDARESNRNDHRRNFGSRDYKSENEGLRIKLSTLSLQLDHLKELFKIENSKLKQDLNNLKEQCVKGLETAIARVRVNVRRQATQRYERVQPIPKEHLYSSPSNKYGASTALSTKSTRQSDRVLVDQDYNRPSYQGNQERQSITYNQQISSTYNPKQSYDIEQSQTRPNRRGLDPSQSSTNLESPINWRHQYGADSYSGQNRSDYDADRYSPPRRQSQERFSPSMKYEYKNKENNPHQASLTNSYYQPSTSLGGVIEKESNEILSKLRRGNSRSALRGDTGYRGGRDNSNNASPYLNRNTFTPHD